MHRHPAMCIFQSALKWLNTSICAFVYDALSRFHHSRRCRYKHGLFVIWQLSNNTNIIQMIDEQYDKHRDAWYPMMILTACAPGVHAYFINFHSSLCTIAICKLSYGIMKQSLSNKYTITYTTHQNVIINNISLHLI